MSSHQQDLPDATLLCRYVSLGRFTEGQFPADRDTSLPSRTASAMNSSVDHLAHADDRYEKPDLQAGYLRVSFPMSTFTP